MGKHVYQVNGRHNTCNPTSTPTLCLPLKASVRYRSKNNSRGTDNTTVNEDESSPSDLLRPLSETAQAPLATWF